MKLILLLLFSLTAWTQITASPTSITVYARQFSLYNATSSIHPPPTTITISGTGAWNMSRAGTLSTACAAGSNVCFTAVTSVSTLCSSTLASGSNAGTVYLCWNGLLTHEPAVGSHTGTLVIGTTTINVTLVVLSAAAYDKWVYKSGYPSGCIDPSGYGVGFDTTGQCTITNERPTSTSFSIPSVGGSYVDPQFGYTVQRVSAARTATQYGALSAFSANATYVLIGDELGNASAYTRTTGVKTYPDIANVNLNYCAWDATIETKLWCQNTASIVSVDITTGTATTAATYAYNISMGGTADITDDNWWVFRALGEFDRFCAVNLNGLTTSNQSTQTYCGSLAPYSLSNIDFIQVTQRDSVTGKRYLVVLGQPGALVWSVGASTLTYEYPLTGISEPHSDVGQDENGRQIFYWSYGDPYGDRYYLQSIQLNRGTDIFVPTEVGGGAQYLSYVHPGVSFTDGHYGCNWRGTCVYSTWGNSQGITAVPIQTITAANPCQINSTAHGYSSTNSVQIGGALGTGVSALNGVHTVTVLGANSYTIPLDCSSGYTYTASSANSSLNTASAVAAPFRQEIILSRLGEEARRLVVHRGKTYNSGVGCLTAYGGSIRASISRDGRYIAFNSNFGVPECASVYFIDVGTTSAQPLGVNVAPADTRAVLDYSVPVTNQGSATIVISTLASLASPVVNASDGLNTNGRQYVATGLTASTEYYYRVTAGAYSKLGRFTTTAALSGNGRLKATVGRGGNIDYGTTSAYGSICVSPCDVVVAKGLIYTNATGAARAVVVR